MRVVQVINHFGLDRGGAERLAQGLHQALRDRGIDARIIAIETCETDGLEGAESLGFDTPYDPRATLMLGRRLRALLRPGDVVHAHLFPTSAHVAALRAVGRINVPCLFTEHNTWNRRRGRALGRLLDRAIYGHFELICAISEGAREALVSSYPTLVRRCCVVLNGCILRFATPTLRNSRSTITVVSVGRLVPQKNYPAAIEALALVENQSWSYIILGEGPERSRLEALIKALGIADRVELRGYVPDVDPILHSADLFLIPSAWEGFGLAAVEAMNAALPIVASDVPGLREVVGDDGCCALLVKPDDPRAIADALSRLANSPKQRRTMGAAGFSRAATFSIDRMTEDYLSCYRLVLEKQHLGAH